ncbi:hypothetical protein CDEST_14370 [Colletotrichum destructivum]|uniref:Uncharacterized protein n=1 Tax=Colletotrichum destructivum TaxID=34406 RepID=A0AAX4J1K8_9PEZI|nr:hypothetical protein CDEST_14370 [Colletotrichum destructivum]
MRKSDAVVALASAGAASALIIPLANNLLGPLVRTSTIPGTTYPGLEIKVSIPPIGVQPIAIPVINLPPVAVPSVTAPSVALPSAALPSIAIPSLNLPSVTLPSIAIPSVTLPSLAFHHCRSRHSHCRLLQFRLCRSRR